MTYNSYDSYDTTAQYDTSWGEIASPGGGQDGREPPELLLRNGGELGGGSRGQAYSLFS